MLSTENDAQSRLVLFGSSWVSLQPGACESYQKAKGYGGDHLVLHKGQPWGFWAANTEAGIITWAPVVASYPNTTSILLEHLLQLGPAVCFCKGTQCGARGRPVNPLPLLLLISPCKLILLFGPIFLHVYFLASKILDLGPTFCWFIVFIALFKFMYAILI